MHLLTVLASTEEETSGTASLLGMLPLLLLPLVAYFLLIRPNRKRMRDQQAMQSELGVGDEVLMTSGIYGFITGFDGDKVWVEVDDDVQLRVARAALQGKVDATADVAGDTDVDADSDEAASRTKPVSSKTAATAEPARDATTDPAE